MFKPFHTQIASDCFILCNNFARFLGYWFDMQAEQSSQWDGFRHYSQPLNTSDPSSSKNRVFYGGTTKDEIMDPSNHRIGIQHWASEGIAGKTFHLLEPLAIPDLPS
jgi:hypothetical protein